MNQHELDRLILENLQISGGKQVIVTFKKGCHTDDKHDHVYDTAVLDIDNQQAVNIVLSFGLLNGKNFGHEMIGSAFKGIVPWKLSNYLNSFEIDEDNKLIIKNDKEFKINQFNFQNRLGISDCIVQPGTIYIIVE